MRSSALVAGIAAVLGLACGVAEDEPAEGSVSQPLVRGQAARPPTERCARPKQLPFIVPERPVVLTGWESAQELAVARREAICRIREYRAGTLASERVWTYDSAGRIVGITDSKYPQYFERYSYDAEGRVNHYEIRRGSTSWSGSAAFNAAGTRSEVTLVEDSEPYTMTTTFRLVSTGRQCGNLYRMTRVVTQKPGATQLSPYPSEQLLVLESTDADGNVIYDPVTNTTYSYWPGGIIKSIGTWHDGTRFDEDGRKIHYGDEYSNQVFDWSYFPDGRLRSMTIDQPHVIEVARYRYTSEELDRITVTGYWTGGSGPYSISTAERQNGRVMRVRVNEYGHADPDLITTYGYDARARLVSVVTTSTRDPSAKYWPELHYEYCN